MNQQPEEKKSGFLRNDRRLVCVMFVIYGLCILGFVGVLAGMLGLGRKALSTIGTSTAFAGETQAAATATAMVHATEQAGYEWIDRFDTNKNHWLTGPPDNNQYWSGYITIQGGVYLWNVKETKETFVTWADFPTSNYIHDFDVYVDTKVDKGSPGDVCSGLMFKKQPGDRKDNSYYYFALCNNSLAKIDYYKGKEGWENITSLEYPSFSGDWNRLEIMARDSHFTFFINGNNIYEMDDARQKRGGVTLVIEVDRKTPARILFDNFGFQPR